MSVQAVEFSLAAGSALIQRLRTLGLAGWIPQSVTGQVALAVLIAWIPLLILTAWQGTALGSQVQIPFLLDLIQHARFLVALPCAIALGRYVNPRLEGVLNSMLKGGVISHERLVDFEHAIQRARTFNNSVAVELFILACVYLYTLLGLHRNPSEGISSWMNGYAGVSLSQTLARRWFLWVSMPLFVLGWFLWMWRMGVWAWLLFRISRLGPRVSALHPDGVGGLNSLNVGMRRFSVLVFAFSSILCASIGEEILLKGTKLRSYELELASFFFVCVVSVLGPLLVFTPALIRSKLEYWSKYSPFAGRYIRYFEDKWIEQHGYTPDELLGTEDIQSLADLRGSYAGIAQMRVVVPNRVTIGIFAAAYLLPAVPLLASVISVRQIVSELYSLLLK